MNKKEKKKKILYLILIIIGILLIIVPIILSPRTYIIGRFDVSPNWNITFIQYGTTLIGGILASVFTVLLLSLTLTDKGEYEDG